MVVRHNNKIFKAVRGVEEIQNAINNIKFVKCNMEHIYNNILKNQVFGKLAPIDRGLIVIDLDRNIIVTYHNGFIIGTIEQNEDSQHLQAFKDDGLIMLDTIDYMLDFRPMKKDNYNCKYADDGELVKKKLLSLGFEFTKEELEYWDSWYKKIRN